MRSHRVLGFSFVTALVALVACSSTDNHVVTVCPDASASSEAGAGDGATVAVHPPVTAPILRTLQTATNVELLGVTTGATPHAVYWVVHYGVSATDARTWDLMATPIWGGDPITIVAGLDDDDPAVVDGGAVAYWTTTSSTSLLATEMGIWTPANGVNTLTTPSFAGLFAATADGATVAYSGASTAGSTPLFVTPSNALIQTGAQLQGGNAVNLQASSTNCSPSLHFAAQTFIASYCTGVDTAATKPSLFTVSNGKANVRLSQVDDIDWSADANGVGIFVRNPLTGSAQVLVLNGDAMTSTPLGTLTFGLMLKSGTIIALDGTSFLVFRPDGTKDVVSKANFLVSASPNDNLIAFSRNTKTVSALDIQIADISVSPPKVTTIHDAATATVIGFTGDSSRILYVSPVTKDADDALEHGALKSQPVGGGDEMTLAPDSYFASAALAGSGIVSTSAASTDDGELIRETFGYLDATKGGAPGEVASIYRFTGGVWFDRTFVYEDLGNNAGVYALEVP